MSADTGSEPDTPKKRGRIPQSAWPEILERYRTGTTLSAIAREFECTPSAISYILRKAEAAESVGTTDAVSDVEGDDAVVASPADEAGAADVPAESAELKPGKAVRAARASRATARPIQPELPEVDSVAPARPVTQPRVDETASRSSGTETLRLNRPDTTRAETSPQPVATPVQAAAVAVPQPTAVEASAPATAGSTAPVDAVEARLRDTARGCLSAYRGWRQQPSEGSIQSLSEAVHELRKALARIEIDMSASRREEQAIRPIPIPAHRAARRTV